MSEEYDQKLPRAVTDDAEATAWDSPATSSSLPGGADASTDTSSTAIKDHAGQVGQEAVDGGKEVAAVAAEQATSVASEAATQARDLLDEAKSQLADQVSSQQVNLSSWLRSVGDELASMAERSHSSAQLGASPGAPGPVAALARQASERVDDVATWLEHHEPAEILDEVSRFARRRPGLFLALAAVGGLLAGRLTRGLTAGSSADPAAALGTRTGAQQPSGAATGDTTVDMSGRRLPAGAERPRDEVWDKPVGQDVR